MAVLVVPVPFRWRLSRTAEADASVCASANCYRRPEYVGVVSMVVAEFKFSDVKREVLFAYLVECANHAALEDRPETFDGLSMDRSDYILLFAVVNGRVGIFFLQAPITNPLVGAKQADFVRNSLMYERRERGGLRIADHPRDDVSVARDCASDDGLVADRAGSGSDMRPAIILMAVALFAANESLIDLDNADQFTEFRVNEGRSNAMAHIPSCLERAEPHVTPHLPRANPFFACQHKMDDAEPLAQIDFCVLKDSASDIGEPITTGAAIRALPFVLHCLDWITARTATTRADYGVRPPMRDQILVTRIFVRERRLELLDRHLVNLAGLLFAGHDKSSNHLKTA